jgi:hypothetical protein
MPAELTTQFVFKWNNSNSIIMIFTPCDNVLLASSIVPQFVVKQRRTYSKLLLGVQIITILPKLT